MARNRDDDDDDDDDRDDDDDDSPRKSKKKKKGGDDNQMAMFCHLGMLIGGFLIPLIIWMMKKDESKFVDRHGKEALNFAITLLIVHMIGPFTLCILNAVATVMSIIWIIKASMAASNGEYYKYPICIRFIK